jgi:hypothetical protein
MPGINYTTGGRHTGGGQLWQVGNYIYVSGVRIIGGGRYEGVIFGYALD